MSNETAFGAPPPFHPLQVELAEAQQAYLDAVRATIDGSARHFQETHARYCTGESCQWCHRATPARVHKPLRLRVCLSYDGPPWLSLLAQCAWLRGGIIGERVVPQPTS